MRPRLPKCPKKTAIPPAGNGPGEPYEPPVDPPPPPPPPDPGDPPPEPVPSITQRSALAYVSHGSIAQWTTQIGVPYVHFGFTLEEGSWPSYDASPGSPLVTGQITLWRNPDGSLWDQPGRFGSITEWKVGQSLSFPATLAINATPLRLRWGPTFIGAGGTQQGSADNGIILLYDDDGVTGYEIQGLARIDNDLSGAATIAGINLRALQPVASYGHYRCDGVYRRGGAVSPTGSQTNLAKYDTLLKPRHLDPGGWGDDEQISLVGYNVAWGATADHAQRVGDHVEHPGPTQPYGLPDVVQPSGPDTKMMRSGEGFAIQITNAKIEEWIVHEGATGALAESKRNFARGARGPVDINGRPTRPRIRLKESGSGYPILESVGGINTVDAVAFAARGITTNNIAFNLGHDILKGYGTLVAI